MELTRNQKIIIHTQERITLSETSRETWILESKAASRVFSGLDRTEQIVANKTLKLKVGDQVWLSARPRVLSVCLVP